MPDSLNQTGNKFGHMFGRAWDNEGWREVLTRHNDALTEFSRNNKESKSEAVVPAAFPHWGLMAVDMEVTKTEVLVRVEAPGMHKEDYRIMIEGKVLNLSGDKSFEREAHDSTYYLSERAYGSFQRAILLPCNVDAAKVDTSYRNGVLSIRLPKLAG